MQQSVVRNGAVATFRFESHPEHRSAPSLRGTGRNVRRQGSRLSPRACFPNFGNAHADLGATRNRSLALWPLNVLGLCSSLAVVGDLLDGPSVAVGIAEEQESAPREVLDVRDLDPSRREIVTGSLDVIHHELKPLEGARLHLREG